MRWLALGLLLAGCADRVLCDGALANGVKVECSCVTECTQESTRVVVSGQWCDEVMCFAVDAGVR